MALANAGGANEHPRELRRDPRAVTCHMPCTWRLVPGADKMQWVVDLAQRGPRQPRGMRYLHYPLSRGSWLTHPAFSLQPPAPAGGAGGRWQGAGGGGLQTPRKIISAIPQGPLLLTVTARENLDPLSKLSDGVLARVLGEVGLDQSKAKCLDNAGRQGRKLRQVIIGWRAGGRYPCLVITFQWLRAADTPTLA
jgi:hypothetical protein